ncbi:glutathione S-transferase family protein [bacterium]|nr:glutathione S-transferase family protein [bacterium]
MKLTLHTMPGTIGVATHVALEEGKFDYETIKVDFARQEQLSDSYRKLNPRQRVPSLVVDSHVLSETPAILFYLAQLAPDAPIALPREPLKIADIQSFNSYLGSTVHVAHAHKMRGARWSNDDTTMASMKAYVPTTMSHCFELIENELLKGPWVQGADFSINDPYLFAISQWLEGDGVDIAKYPKVQQHHASMLHRASVQKVLVA